MIHIVGGTYRERCIEPQWNELFGSGGRAAAALTLLNDKVFLTTYIAENEKPYLQYLADTFAFHLGDNKIVPQTLSFDYHHCLSDPIIRPTVAEMKTLPSLLVEDKYIIRYGFLEGNAVVNGEKVVYDPQNEYSSELFTANGSTAKKLAIVANTSECQKLTDSPHDLFDAEVLGKKLLELEGAEVVVVKQGSLGALVVTSSKTELVPAYYTKRVFSIGSGDIFTAVFAHFWTSGNMTPFQAAHMASLATAYYCDTRRLPITANFDKVSTYQPIKPKNEFPSKPKQVYLAGPFFSMAERWMIGEARKHLYGEGFNVFSPLHDVGLGKASTVALRDIEGLIKSDIMFAVLDNLDPGTVFEIGYAVSLNIPVIVFVENASDKDLTMITGTGCEVFDDFASAIYRTVWTAMRI